MSLITMREGICAKLRERVDHLVAVTTHGGRFGTDDLRRYATQAPCAIVGLMGVVSAEIEGGTVVADLFWGIFLLGVDRKVGTGLVRRDAMALALVETTLGVVRADESWGEENAHGLKKVRADNHFNKVCDEQGVSMWSVSWTQKLDLPAVDPGQLTDFLLYVSETTVEGAAFPATPKATDRLERETDTDLAPAGES